MRSISTLLLLAALLQPAHTFAIDPDGPQAPPNILLIMLDDLGVNDLGISGNPEAKTPNIDSFAAQGVHFTRHYADTTCSVARASMLTSTFPAQHGMRPDHLGLSPGTVTIASTLRNEGYHTQHIGKWHVATASLQQSPTQAGFSNWFGFLHQKELQGEPNDGVTFERPTYNDPWLRENQSTPMQIKGHLTDILTDRAVKYLQSRVGTREPWFLNLWFYAPHTPLQPGQKYAQRHADSDAGRYRALIEQVDASVGRVLKALDESGQSENTLVILLSDNGARDNGTDSNFPYAGTKSGYLEGSFRTPLLMRWPGHIEEHTSVNQPVTILDIFPTISNAVIGLAPEGIIGRNLLAAKLEPMPQLYWEKEDSLAYSVLSGDGRWRLTKSYYFPEQLLCDLETEPSGNTNVARQHPEIVSQLTKDYIQWHSDNRLVEVDYNPFNDHGGAVLTGKDLMRSPGRSDFTFAIGVTPGASSKEPQVLARQALRWQLQLDKENRVKLWILGKSFEGPTLPKGQCSDIVVSTRYLISMLRPHNNKATIRIFLNAKQVSVKELPRPNPMNWGYANPTYIGIHSNGGNRFQGQLTKPVILNEHLVPADQGNALGLNVISSLPSSCAHSNSVETP